MSPRVPPKLTPIQQIPAQPETIVDDTPMPFTNSCVAKKDPKQLVSSEVCPNERLSLKTGVDSSRYSRSQIESKLPKQNVSSNIANTNGGVKANVIGIPTTLSPLPSGKQIQDGADKIGEAAQKAQEIAQPYLDSTKRTINGAVIAYGEDQFFIRESREAQHLPQLETVYEQNKEGRAAGHTLSALQSAAEIASGSATFVGGTLLDATGIGALAGVPAQIASVTSIVHGATTGAHTLYNIAHENEVVTNWANDKTQSEKPVETATEIKPTDATANGANNAKNETKGVDGGITVEPANKTKDVTYKGVEIVDSKGSPVGEFDRIENGLLIEEKSAQGINKLNPVTGQPVQTPQQWAKKQVYDKSVTRIENISKAADTRKTNGGSTDVPSLQEIKSMKRLEFRIENATPEVRNAVQAEVKNLSKKYPDWTFTTKFGN